MVRYSLRADQNPFMGRTRPAGRMLPTPVLNKHAPLKQLSRREKKLSLKPWITKGIYTSIKTKIDYFELVINMVIAINFYYTNHTPTN